jgi:hypothetical protein
VLLHVTKVWIFVSDRKPRGSISRLGGEERGGFGDGVPARSAAMSDRGDEDGDRGQSGGRGDDVFGVRRQVRRSGVA